MKGHMFKSMIAMSVLAVVGGQSWAGDAPEAREMEIVAVGEAHGDHDGKFEFKMKQEMEKATFLGVGTSPAGETLGEQLGLPRGIGLTVEFVTKDSPAEQAGIKQHDVLHKLNDQLLCNVEQLATLVRMNKPGDTVKVTLIRKGEPMEISATLVEREMPKMDWSMMPGKLEDHLIKLKGMGGAYPREFGVNVEPRFMFLGEGGKSIVKRDKQRTISINVDGDERHVTIVDGDKVIYDGPFDTDEEKAKVDAEIRMQVEDLEDDVPEIDMEDSEPTTQPSN